MVRATGQLGTGDTEFPEELMLELSGQKPGRAREETSQAKAPTQPHSLLTA